MRFPNQFPAIFLEEIRRESGGSSRCAHCRSDAGGKSMCPQHLALARARWHVWTRERNSKGLCWQCHRKHILGQQRCRLHTKKNQDRCRAWGRKNRKMLLQRYQDRKADGLCVNNPAHGPALKPHTRCLDCHTRQKVWRQNRKVK